MREGNEESYNDSDERRNVLMGVMFSFSPCLKPKVIKTIPALRTAATASSGDLAYPCTSETRETASQSDATYLIIKPVNFIKQNNFEFFSLKLTNVDYPSKPHCPLAVLDKRLKSAQLGTPFTLL